MGYHLAFPQAEIVGVDLVPMPRYPFTFMQEDVFGLTWAFLSSFDLIHAGPPCHDHSTAGGTARKQSGSFGTGWMLEAVTERLRSVDVPWVVENVQGATMPDAPYSFRLCGSSFLMDIRRHRKFISNFPVDAPPCAHGWQTPRFQSLANSLRKKGQLASVVGVHGHAQFPGDRQLRERAMRIDWMTLDELNESIPPCYTQWIGLALAQTFD